MSEELKPCPFCGSDDQVEHVILYGYHYIKCHDCWGYMGKKDTKQEAIEAWNKRVEKVESDK